ncbi:MAG: hypothetical protein FWH11_01565 [Micrococcales bacterium]|nr:hypothetical protein [Micrococcales bacterium]
MTARGSGPRGSAVVLMVIAAALALGGCGSDDGGATSSPTPSVQTASWAQEVVTGEKLWQASNDGLTLTAYVMGEDTAEQDALYFDDVTNEPLVAKGDRILFVNLVLTNTGDETRYIATDQPKLLAAPAESPYTQQGVAEITYASDDQWREHDVWYHTVRLGSGQSSPYPLAPGERCARGYILPLSLGLEWGFVGAVWVYAGTDDSGRSVTFEPQSHTFT